MLQRLVIRPPTPLKNNPHDNTIFTKDGKIREQYHKLSLELNINPDELYPKDLESFKGADVPRNVQILRYNNFENKRRAKIEALRSLARQRNLLGGHKPVRPGSNSTRARQINLGAYDGPTSEDKEGHRLGQGPGKESHSSLQKVSAAYGENKTGHNNSMDTVSNASGGLGRSSAKGLERKGSGSLSNLDLETDECDVGVDLEGKFKRYIAYKRLEKERLMNASVLVTKKDEERSEQIKKAYEEKLQKWNKKQEEKEKKNKKKKEDVYNDEEYKRERIEKQREMQRERQKATYERMIERIAKSEAQKKVELDKKVNKLMQLNNTFQERYVSCMKRREIETDFYIKDSLNGIQTKFNMTERRKRIFLDEKKSDASRHLSVIEGRLQKVREEAKEKESTNLKKLIGKMEQVRSRSALLSKKKVTKEQRPIEEDPDFSMRLEEITQREIAKEKKRLESFKEKEKKTSLLLKNKVNVLSDFIAERREIWTQKQENIHENKGIARQAGDKFIEQQVQDYKDKMGYIQKLKNERNKELVKNNLL